MKTQLLGALALSIAASSAAYAGHQCGKMKKAYDSKPIYYPTVMMRYNGHSGMSEYAMKDAGHRAKKTANMTGYGKDGQPVYKMHSPDIIDTAVSARAFNTLLSAVQAAGLEGTLRGEGPYTVFAPSDEAFAKLPQGTLEGLLADEDKLKKVLTYHVVPGKVMAADLVTRRSVDTVEGSALPARDISVSKADIVASNGVIHVVDEVLIPKM